MRKTRECKAPFSQSRQGQNKDLMNWFIYRTCYSVESDCLLNSHKMLSCSGKCKWNMRAPQWRKKGETENIQL